MANGRPKKFFHKIPKFMWSLCYDERYWSASPNSCGRCYDERYWSASPRGFHLNEASSWRCYSFEKPKNGFPDPRRPDPRA